MAEIVRSELPNLWRSMNEPRACRHLYQICPQTKGRFKRQPCYTRWSTDPSEHGRPRDFRLCALKKPTFTRGTLFGSRHAHVAADGPRLSNPIAPARGAAIPRPARGFLP